jgi:CheY-like chemotaxis protein
MKKILIVEDDPIVAKVYRTYLERNRFEIEVAADARGALERLAGFQPDGLLLDLMLPNENGIELLKQIRASAGFKATPVIAFTNAFVHKMVELAVEAGATQVFDKAKLTPPTLLDALRGLLEPKAQAKAAA